MTTRVLPAVFVLTLMAVGACSSAGADSSAPNTTPMEGSVTPSSSADLDQAFIDMMVPHHQSAIEMAKVAKERSEREEILTLADEIIGAQEGEIAQLRGWRQDWFGSDETPGMDAMPLIPGMEMPGMDGMAMDGIMDMTADVEALKTAEPFDRAFIEAMTEHHETAIEAATLVAAATDRAELQTIAADIIEAQQREIDQMQGWLVDWYPS